MFSQQKPRQLSENKVPCTLLFQCFVLPTLSSAMQQEKNTWCFTPVFRLCCQQNSWQRSLLRPLQVPNVSSCQQHRPSLRQRHHPRVLRPLRLATQRRSGRPRLFLRCRLLGLQGLLHGLALVPEPQVPLGHQFLRPEKIHCQTHDQVCRII